MRYKLQIRLLLASLALLLAIAPAAKTQAAAAIQAVEGIDTTVADMDRSVTFYARVLSFEKVSDQEIVFPAASSRARVVAMKLGDERIELVQFRGRKGQPIPPDSRSNDLWFQHVAIIVSDMDRAYAILKANSVQAASVAPQRLPDWNKITAGIRALYFRDPDGHPLEILQFPEGKGDAKWHRNSGKLFLGIDHTAIVVGNTDASLRFYRDLLGMRVAGESENYGPEQEKLNNVPGAHLRITSLRAERGPGVELLEYLSPRNGRRLAHDPQRNDLVQRDTLLITNNPDGLLQTLQTTGAMPQRIAGQQAFSVRDPDGHELLIRAPQSTTIGELK
jgi:catechol 2,3-dioxygenase-like lactoylglutathione lyase family enzyme